MDRVPSVETVSTPGEALIRVSSWSPFWTAGSEWRNRRLARRVMGAAVNPEERVTLQDFDRGRGQGAAASAVRRWTRRQKATAFVSTGMIMGGGFTAAELLS